MQGFYVYSCGDGLLGVLWVTDHVHDWNSGLVKLVDHLLWWDTDGGDKQLGLARDDHIDQFWQLTMGVVVICLARSSTDLRQQKINTKLSQVSLCHPQNGR